MPHRSILTNLAVYSDYITTAMEKSMEVHSVYTDFSKAFDKVNIDILLVKLGWFGVRGELLEWFRSCLTGRKQFVTFNGSQSETFSPESGVPQGSILGPILFLIFINDLIFNIEAEILVFADDMKIFKAIKCASDCDAIQRSICLVNRWCLINGLPLNPSKCFHISFTNKTNTTNFVYHIGGNSIAKVNQIKDLGVTFDSKMSFHPHIVSIVSRAHRNLGFVMRMTKDFDNTDCIKHLYCALVRNGMEFASQIWSPHQVTYSNKIEAVQRKLTRFLNFKLHIPKLVYTDRLLKFDLITLYDRRMLADMILLFKLINGLLDVDLSGRVVYHTPAYPTRYHPVFQLPFSRTSIGLSTNPLNRVQRNFNANFNKIDLFELPVKKFKLSVCTLLKRGS